MAGIPGAQGRSTEGGEGMTDRVMIDINEERHRQDKKWGEQNHDPWGGYWWDEPPPGKKYFLAELMDGHYLEHPFIVLPARKTVCRLILWARKTVKSITGPGRSCRG